MIDNVLINITMKGRIPWINQEGPIYGIYVSLGIFQILEADPRLHGYIEKTTPEAVAKFKAQQAAAAKAAMPVVAPAPVAASTTETKTITLTDSAQVVDSTKPVEASKEDIEIDKALESANAAPASTFGKIDYSKDEDTKMKVYVKTDLQKMTKKELKQILLDRGHVNDNFTGRYHDNLPVLIQKVLDSQNL
jgi:hypothetical protein